VSRRDEIVDVAERLLEAEGPETLSMRRLAEEMGIRAPSLYKHIRSKDEIEAALQQRGLESLGEALADAGTGLVNLGSAYRRWALLHPRLYDLMTRRPLAREQIAEGVDAAASAPVLAAAAGDINLARALWGLAHGLVDLELAGRFPPGADIDAAWRTAFEAFPTGRPS
jgi:AcrR family transcriptional regulator